MPTRLLPLVALLAASGCALTSLIGYRVAPDYPDDAATERLALPGLRGPATITLDALGVPHVRADSLVDLARATGFAQGRARFFEMDMMRRLARGRVSELVGEQPFVGSTTVAYDRSMRGWEIEARAKADFEKLAPEELELLQAFTGGVNAALRRWKPVEYRLLGVEPTPWEPSDTLAIGLLNVWSITHNYQQEAVRLLLAMSVGVERMDAIYPAEPLGGRTVASSRPPLPLPPSVVPELQGLFPLKRPEDKTINFEHAALDLSPVLLHGGASNSWVVSGAHSRSGKPLLANDPHLTHFLPGIVMQEHLQGPDLDVIGITVPGLPWVISGHNQRVAWAITSTMADVVDLVLEKDDARPGLVQHEGGDCPLTTREETIRVRVGSRYVEQQATFRRTCNGPLYNDLAPGLFPKGSPLVAIRWRVQGLERALAVLLQVDRAKSAEELGHLVADLPSTYNVFNVADVDGHIGSYPSGEVPQRPNHRGTFPVPGWLAKYEWRDWAKGDQVPHALDPEDGLLAHANNLVADPGSPDFARIQVDSAPPYRVERIQALARATPKHDLASFEAMQVDTYSLRAQAVVPAMLEDLRGAELSEGAKVARELLERWDFDARADRPEAAIFFETYRLAVLAAVEDELAPEAVHFFLGQRYSTNTCDLWFRKADHVVWDDRRTPKVETRAQVVVKAFEDAVATLVASQGFDPKAWRWGALHWHRPTHAFGGNPLLAGTVNLEKMGAGGELDSIWKSHFDLGSAQSPFKAMAGPVYRQVVDLADPAHAWWTVDTGSSGWPLSPHYGDQYKTWRAGGLAPMLTDLEEIRRGEHGELTLTP